MAAVRGTLRESGFSSCFSPCSCAVRTGACTVGWEGREVPHRVSISYSQRNERAGRVGKHRNGMGHAFDLRCGVQGYDKI